MLAYVLPMVLPCQLPSRPAFADLLPYRSCTVPLSLQQHVGLSCMQKTAHALQESLDDENDTAPPPAPPPPRVNTAAAMQRPLSPREAGMANAPPPRGSADPGAGSDGEGGSRKSSKKRGSSCQLQ